MFSHHSDTFGELWETSKIFDFFDILDLGTRSVAGAWAQGGGQRPDGPAGRNRVQKYNFSDKMRSTEFSEDWRTRFPPNFSRSFHPRCPLLPQNSVDLTFFKRWRTHRTDRQTDRQQTHPILDAFARCAHGMAHYPGSQLVTRIPEESCENTTVE